MDNLSFSNIVPPFPDIFTKRLFDLHAEKNDKFFSFLNAQCRFLFNNQYDISADQIKITACFADNNLVGSAFLYLPHPELPYNIKNAFISNVFVLPQFRHRGIAARCIQICEEISLSFGCNSLLLATGDEGLRKNFYNKLGFQCHKADKYLMFKPLCKCEVIPPQVKESVYKITPVDLANVQYICSVKHYKLAYSQNAEEINGCEIEEYFSEIIVMQPDQYLILKNINTKWYLLDWVIPSCTNYPETNIVFSNIKIDSENQALFMNVIHNIKSTIKKYN